MNIELKNKQNGLGALKVVIVIISNIIYFISEFKGFGEWSQIIMIFTNHNDFKNINFDHIDVIDIIY